MTTTFLMESATASVCAWLLTYAVHSTVALGVAWALSRALSRRAHAFHEGLWKSALVIGLITATLQTGFGTAPGGGFGGVLEPSPTYRRLDASSDISLPTVSEADNAPRCLLDLDPERMPFPERERERIARERAALKPDEASGGRIDTQYSLPLLALLPRDHGGPSTPLWAEWFVGLWVLVASGLTARHIVLRRRLRRLLRTRRPVTGGPLLAVLDDLCRSARIKSTPMLTTSDHLPGPIAVSRSEICIPERALTQLGPNEQEGMLAHELAHIVRRDHDWLRLGLLLENLLFFQPMHRIARRQLQENSEYLCDAWAVGRTGEQIALARCLAEVAEWVSSSPSHAVPGMAPRGSSLVRRVQSLLAPEPGALRRMPLAVAVPVVLGLIAMGTWVVPGVSPSASAPPECRVIAIEDGGRVLILPDGRDVIIAGTGRLQLQQGGRVVALPEGYVVTARGRDLTRSDDEVRERATLRILDEKRSEAWRIRVADSVLDLSDSERRQLQRRGLLMLISNGSLERASFGESALSESQVVNVGSATWLLDDRGRPLVDVHGFEAPRTLKRPRRPTVDIGFFGGGKRLSREGTGWTIKARSKTGIHVHRVDPGSPAERAGLRTYDVVVKACGEPIDSLEDLDEVLLAKQPGDRLVLDIVRKKTKRSLSLQVAPVDTGRMARDASARICADSWRRAHLAESDARESGDLVARDAARETRADITRHVKKHVGLRLWESLLARPDLRFF